MARLILDRYRPMGTAGSGGFGTVQIAWDTRIQRTVAIKCIKLTDVQAARAAYVAAAGAAKPAYESSAESGADTSGVSPASSADEAAVEPPPWDESWAAMTNEEIAAADATSAAVPDDADRDDELAAGDARPEEEWAEVRSAVPSGRRSMPGSNGVADRKQGVFAALGIGRGGGNAPVAEDPSRTVVFTRDGSSVEEGAAWDDMHWLASVPGLDEARTAAMLSDPNIVTVYDFEVQGSQAYLIMEYVDGLTLTQVLNEHEDALTLDIVASVLADVAHALEVAHKNQVLHLDIKPDNILIDGDGRAKVTDFGLATLADAQGQGVAGGGTIGYMPLEQLCQRQLDARSDEWALASVVYEMLCGENPFRASSLSRAKEVVVDAELVVPSLCWDDLDAEADDAVFYALDPDPDERYETVSEFAEELLPYLGSARRGKKQLAAIVAGVDGEEDDDGDAVDAEPAAYQRRERVPLADRLTPGVVALLSHAFGAVSSAWLVAIGLACAVCGGASWVSAPVIGACVVAVGALGAVRPRFGALASFVATGASLAFAQAPVAGAALIAASVAWWAFVFRDHRASRNACANAALSFALLGAVPLGVAGFSVGSVLATGAFAKVREAVATSVLGFLVLVMLSGATSAFFGGSPDLIGGYDAVSLLGVLAQAASGKLPHAMALAGSLDVQRAIGSVLADAGTWALLGGWAAASALASVCCSRGSRALACAGAVLAAAMVALAAVAAVLLRQAGALDAFAIAACIAAPVVSAGVFVGLVVSLGSPRS